MDDEPFRIWTDREIIDWPAPRFLADGVLEAGSSVLVYGPPGCSKTNLVLGLAYCVGHGVPWIGRATMQGAVVYVAAEGGHGLGPRIRAQQAVAGEGRDRPSSVHFAADPVQLLDPTAIDRLLSAVASIGSAHTALVVFDTLARCTLGADENSASDMGRVVANLDRVRKATGAAVLVIHHANSSALRERGSTALRGAVDTVLSMTADGKIITLKCEKQRNAEEFDRITLKRRSVWFGDGTSSCVLELVDDSDLSEVWGSEHAALQALREVDAGDGVSMTSWKEAAEIQPGLFQRSVKRLVERGNVLHEGSGTARRYHLGRVV